MKIFSRLIQAFRKLPGVGPKQAERFALYVARAPEGELIELLDSISDVRSKIRLCPQCFNYTNSDLCEICADENRNHSIICVIESVQDLEAIEKTGFYKGVYHVLGGTFSPNMAVGVESIRLKELSQRVSNGSIKEIIIATNPSAEGETTAAYIKNMLEKKVEKISRIAFGVPLGGDLNYMDELTLTHALEGRRKL